MSRKKLRPLLRKIARLARERYGAGVKLRTLQDYIDATLFIDFVLPDRTVTDTLTITQERGCDPHILYTREVRLRWLETDTAETLLDELEAIRTSTVRQYWKAHPNPEEQP